jgi:hypothetical protein
MEEAKFGSELFHKEANIKYLRQTISSEIQKLVLPQKIHKNNVDADENGSKEDEKSRFNTIQSLYWKLSNFNSNVESNFNTTFEANNCKVSNEIDAFFSKESLSDEKHENKNKNSVQVKCYDAETLQKLIFYGCLNDYEFLLQLMAYELFNKDKNSNVLFLFNQADDSIVLRKLISKREISGCSVSGDTIYEKQSVPRVLLYSIRRTIR